VTSATARRTAVRCSRVTSDAELLEAWRAGRLLDQKRAQAKARLQALATRETAGWADEIALLLAVRQLAAGSKLRDGES